MWSDLFKSILSVDIKGYLFFAIGIIAFISLIYLVPIVCRKLKQSRMAIEQAEQGFTAEEENEKWG